VVELHFDPAVYGKTDISDYGFICFVENKDSLLYTEPSEGLYSKQPS